MPSNQWLSRRPPTSSRAGVTRTSAPASQPGTAPDTGRLSTAVSSSRLVKPSRLSVFVVCDIAVAMVETVPSTLD
jgi:hypothetical protein